MSFFSDQLWFCNCCGMEQHSPPVNAFGRDYRCCSMNCIREMAHRAILSTLNLPYVPRKEEKEEDRK